MSRTGYINYCDSIYKGDVDGIGVATDDERPPVSRSSRGSVRLRMEELSGWLGTDRGRGARGRGGGAAAAATRAGRAGAWSSRAAGRALPARAWRARGCSRWVAPSRAARRGTSAHTHTRFDTAVRYSIFSEDFFRRGWRRGERGDQWRRSTRPRPPAELPPRSPLLLFTYRILKGFSACRYGFSYAGRNRGARRARGATGYLRGAARATTASTSTLSPEKHQTSPPFILSTVFIFCEERVSSPRS